MMMLLDKNKNKGELLQELADIRQRMMDLEISEYERDQMEVALRDSLTRVERAKQEWEVTVDSLPQLVCLLDYRGRVIRTNRAVETWGLGGVTNTKGQTVSEVLHPQLNDAPSVLDIFLSHAWPRLLRGKSSEREVEDELSKRHLHIQIHPISRQTGHQSQAADSFAVLIVDDVTERKQADRLKNEFLNNMSQELQTPLNSIIGYSQLMLTGLAGELPPEILEDVRAIHENGQQLVNLVNEILDLAEIETGSLTLTLEDVALEPLLQRIVLNHSGIPSQKPIKIDADIEPNLPPIRADRYRLHQVLNHLLVNAIKFTDEGRINLRAYQENDWICVEVEDTGIGIEEANLDLIFEKFRQVDGSLSRSVNGVGLGLAITRHLVQMHGGTIAVCSQPGQGTTFTVWLPLQQDNLAAESLAEAVS